ncbi:hypothetical protein AA0535_0628 [Asaia krungthepensis NRIC 0535]|uniref:Methyltransferase n=1 Tax=Asaia krungthepensis NRIC 0535 TaxID=1307925 RepID=A0ABQ0PYR4_9PROT|nr:hypothetical protein AA0535_0628 [Asaia krungthepensis NRIC 0535]
MPDWPKLPCRTERLELYYPEAGKGVGRGFSKGVASKPHFFPVREGGYALEIGTGAPAARLR